MRARIFGVAVIVGAAVGFTFAAFSTYDFVAHLDRQVHGLHCSFLPGLGDTEASGSGCAVTLMSPYSSVFREAVWGGIPISLPAMSVFAFITAFAAFLMIKQRETDRRATLFLLLATALPLLTSAVMAYISLSTLGAACKLCIGIYVASAVVFVSALALFLMARRTEGESTSWGWGGLAIAFGVGVAFVVLPVSVYAGSSPDFERYVGACGELSQPDDPMGVLVPIGPQGRGVQMIEVLDPLCPSCKAFEERYSDLPATEATRRRALLFPLDDRCNWMVDHAIHPGACAVSEAMLCAGDDADEVAAWAFAEQERIVEAARADPEAAARMAKERFPQYRDCIGSPTVQARLNLGLRWAVDNQLPVLTPQVYVGGTRLCDEDTDLGLDFALTRLIDQTPVTDAPPPPTERPRPSAAVASRDEAAAAAATATEAPAPPDAPAAEGAEAPEAEAAAPSVEEEAAPDDAPAPAPTAPTPVAPAPAAPAPAAPTPAPPAAAAPAPTPPAAAPPAAPAPTTDTEVTP